MARVIAPSQIVERYLFYARGHDESAMDNVGVVVNDLAAAIAFFVELGLELEGEAAVEGRRVDLLQSAMSLPGSISLTTNLLGSLRADAGAAAFSTETSVSNFALKPSLAQDMQRLANHKPTTLP